MIVALLAVALIVGAGTALLLWSHGLFVAFMGAAIMASAAVFLAAVVVVRLGARSAEDGRGLGPLAQWLGRRDQR